MTISDYLYIVAILFWVRATDEKTAATATWGTLVLAVAAQLLESIAP